MKVDQYKFLTENFPYNWVKDHRILWSAHNSEFIDLKDGDDLEVGLIVIDKYDDIVLKKYSKNPYFLENLLESFFSL